MANTNNIVFKGLHIMAWLIFVGLSIEFGGLIVNFIFSLYKPDFIQNLYQKLDLTEMYNLNKWIFLTTYSFILTIAILKVILFYVVIKLMRLIDLSKPFSNFVSKQILLISYYTLSIGLLSYIARQWSEKLLTYNFAIEKLNVFWEDSQAFILMAAIIYIIAIIFKRGIDLQNENDLTI